jgi:hypothetical protein
VYGEAEHTMQVILKYIKISSWGMEIVSKKDSFEGSVNCGNGNCLKSVNVSDYLFRVNI